MSGHKLTKTEKAKVAETICRFCDILMELGVDSVQVIATVQVGGDHTQAIREGKGNLFARMGSVKFWLDEMESDEYFLLDDGDGGDDGEDDNGDGEYDFLDKI